MKRYPLQTLLKLREHRVEAARRVVLERQREAQRCRDECARIEGEIIALEFERNQQRARLMDAPPPGVAWPVALAQREAHVDWLQAQAEAARQRLFKTQEVLRQAEEALQQARDAFFRAKARQDALEKRKDIWRGDQHALELRQEEAAVDDLPLLRHPFSGLH